MPPKGVEQKPHTKNLLPGWSIPNSVRLKRSQLVLFLPYRKVVSDQFLKKQEIYWSTAGIFCSVHTRANVWDVPSLSQISNTESTVLIPMTGLPFLDVFIAFWWPQTTSARPTQMNQHLLANLCLSMASFQNLTKAEPQSSHFIVPCKFHLNGTQCNRNIRNLQEKSSNQKI